jgi:hypothetical protein
VGLIEKNRVFCRALNTYKGKSLISIKDPKIFDGKRRSIIMRSLTHRFSYLSMLIVVMSLTGLSVAAPPQPDNARIPIRVSESILVQEYPPPTYAVIYTVPEGKRLVIETINIFPSPVGFMWLEVQKPDNTMEFLLALSFDMSEESPYTVLLKSVRLYLESKEKLWFAVSSGLSGDITMGNL